METRLYAAYDGAPVILEPDSVSGSPSTGLSIHLKDSDGREETIKVSPSHYYDMAPFAMESLLEDLVPGSEFKDDFVKEYELFKSKRDDVSYGVSVWYPRNGDVVRYAPPRWHQLSFYVRNKTLYQDPEMRLSWRDVREKFERPVVAIAGCSLGGNVARVLFEDLHPCGMKLADAKTFHVSNANRLPLTYRQMGLNKAEATAFELQSMDPFMTFSVYNEGVHIDNIEDFVGGNPARNEPPATIIVEEMDDLDMKIHIREVARRFRIPVFMVSDLGQCFQIDVQRFDLDNSPPLMGNSISDDKLFEKLDRWHRTHKQEDFMELFLAIVGTDCLSVPEFKQLMLPGLSPVLRDRPPVVREIQPMFKGLPQLGSTATKAGAELARHIGLALLGFELQERTFFDQSAIAKEVSHVS